MQVFEILLHLQAVRLPTSGTQVFGNQTTAPRNWQRTKSNYSYRPLGVGVMQQRHLVDVP